MEKRLFALDHNFPEPVLGAFASVMPMVEVVPVRLIESGWATVDDRELLLPLATTSVSCVCERMVISFGKDECHILGGMLPVLLAVLIFGGVLAFGVYMLRWQQKKGEALLAAWAGQQHLRILEREVANPPGTGPMNRNAANKQILYRIKAVDESGQVRQGTVRIGSALAGVLSDDITVEWGP